MKLLCRYSGETFHVEHFMEDKELDVHPIFHLSAGKLLSKAKTWGSGKYTETEERLLFLALANSTGAFTFDTPARPSRSIVSQNMEGLFKLVLWYDHVGAGSTVKLPRFRVTEQNWDLNNFSIFLNSWYQCREDWSQPSSRLALQNTLEVLEDRLRKDINSWNKTTESYSRRLFAWAKQAGKVPTALQEYWEQLFTLKGDDVYTARLVDLEEMKDHFLEHLLAPGSIGAGYGSEFADEAIKRAVDLWSRCSRGRLADLIDGDNYSFISEQGEKTSLEDIEAVNTAILAAKAPVDEPKIENYPGRLKDYVLAKASWTLAQLLVRNS